MAHRAAYGLCCAALLTLLASSCQTRQPVEPTTPDTVRAGSPIFFRPAVPQAPIMLESGRYPNLFGGTSRATWIDAQAAAPAAGTTPATATVVGMEKEDLAMMTEPVAVSGMDDHTRMMAANFNVIVCEIESTFTDTSIAYDVVGFRGIQAYLLAADGRQFTPVQRVIGTELKESNQGALKQYRRKNILLFPKEPIPVTTPLEGSRSPAMRLVLEGYGSKFYFEWPAQVPGSIGAPPIGEQEWVVKGEEAYRKTKKKAGGIMHRFD